MAASAATTLVPTTAKQSAKPSESEVDPQGLALRVLAEQVGKGRGGPVISGALAGLLVAALAMAWHLNSEDRSLQRRFDEQDRRISAVERTQDRIALNIEAIALTVGARVVPMQE